MEEDPIEELLNEFEEKDHSCGHRDIPFRSFNKGDLSEQWEYLRELHERIYFYLEEIESQLLEK